MSWTEIADDPTYQALPGDRKERIKTNYFNKEIAPNVPSQELNGVRTSFFKDAANDKETNDALASIGGIIHRATTAMPEFALMRDRLVDGIKAGANELGNIIEDPEREARKVKIPLTQTIARGIEESAGGIAEGVSETLAAKGHPGYRIPETNTTTTELGGALASVAAGPGLVDLAVPKEFSKRNLNADDIAQMYATGKIVDAISMIPSPAIPPIRWILNNIRYKLGLKYPDYFSKGETGLALVEETSLRQALAEGRLGLANARRSNPAIFKEELNKRGLTPEQLKIRPPLTPEETSEMVLKAEDLHPQAAGSAQLAPRTFAAATSISQTPPASSERIGALQGSINQILKLPPGTPVTPESYHRAMETGKLSRIEALEIDEQIFKAEAGKEGIPAQAQGELYRHSQVAAQKPVEFKVIKDLADAVKSELLPQSPPSPTAKAPEFHEMTREAFQAEAANVSAGAVSPELASQVHQDVIEQAIGEGKDVPAEVIASHAPTLAERPPILQPASPEKIAWTPQSGGWNVEKEDRPGVQLSRGDDLVIKTASGKFKAFKEDHLIGQFDTAEKAAQAVEFIDQDAEERNIIEEKKSMGPESPTPARDIARKYGLSKAKLIKGDYVGEAQNLKGIGIIKNKGGLSPDELAEKMFEDNIIPEHDLNMMWDILDKEARLGPKSKITAKTGMSGTSSLASKGDFVQVEPETAEISKPISKIMPLEMPELVRLSRELLGRYPDISRRMGASTRGLFTSGGATARIKLRPELFADTDTVAKVLAHEIGHANDYLPEETLARGNLIGRIGSFNRYLKDTYRELNEDLPDIKYTARELKKELISLSEFWRPYDRDTAAPSFIKYRESSKELYADALSVFLNSPGTLKKMAPKFFDSLIDNLDRKPKFKEEWLDIQDLLNGSREDILKARREDIRQMGMKSEEILIRKQLEKQQQLQSTGDQLMQGITDRFFPILKMANEIEAKGLKIPDHLNPKYVFQEGDMVGNEKALMDLALDKILVPLRRQYGIGPIELHEYGFNNRILHDRSGLANPLGVDAKAAQENLDYLKRELGGKAYGALKAAADSSQEIFWPVVEEAHELGVISDELFNNAIIPNRGNYVTYAVNDYLERSGYISASMQSQTGTLREVGNTWLSTRMKTQAMMDRNADQRNKLSFKNVMDTLHPGELKKTSISRMGQGPGIEKPEPGKEVIYMYEDGKRVAYDVDPYIAQAFEKWKPAQMGLVIRALNLTSYPFKMMYTMENAGFILFTSPLRYFEKTYKGLSGVENEGIIPLLANYIVSLPDAFSKAIGKPNELVQQLLKEKALDVNMSDLELAPELNSYRQKAKQFEMEQNSSADNALGKRVRDKLLYPVRQLMHGMQIAADTSTSAWKIAAAKIRLKAGQSGPEMAYNVRNYAGIPNPRVKGLWAKQTNSFFLFGNILQRHFMTAYQVLTMPTTESGARLKTAALDVVPAIYQTLATLGVLGYSLKEFYERYSKYDRRHYTLIPLGSIKGGEYGWKAVAIPIPHDDAGRIIHAMTTEIITALAKNKPREFEAMLGELWSTLPGITPALEIPRAWIQEYTGGKAWDAFRQRTVIPDAVEKIGGLAKLEKMLEWTMNETGLTNFQSYNDATKSTTETVIQAAPLINRMLKISDYGKTEKFKEEMQDFPLAGEAYSLKQKKKAEGKLSREDTLRLQVLQYQAKQYHANVKREQAGEKAAP